jgi:TRAP-type C4-dicarboxylate transport system substrate-binding protein
MDIGFTTSLYTQGILPQMGVQDLPFLFDTPEEFLTMMDDPEFEDIKEFILTDPLKKWRQTPITWFAYGGYMFAGPKWVEDFDSWQGLRVRVYSKPMAQMVKMFGAVPVNVTWAEVYTALQRKMIDGFMTATAGAYPAKLFESTKWVTLNDYSVGLHFLTINDRALNSLPEDLRQTFLEACRVNTKILQDDYFLEDARAIKMAMKTNGVRFKAMNPVLKKATREKMYPQWITWADKYSYGGETERIIDRINEFHEMYMNENR